MGRMGRFPRDGYSDTCQTFFLAYSSIFHHIILKHFLNKTIFLGKLCHHNSSGTPMPDQIPGMGKTNGNTTLICKEKQSFYLNND
jgi:hypothetical protein